jgi:hypothetical protein
VGQSVTRGAATINSNNDKVEAIAIEKIGVTEQLLIGAQDFYSGLRSLETLAQRKKNKVGRPKLPTGEAKGRIVPALSAPNELRMEDFMSAHELQHQDAETLSCRCGWSQRHDASRHCL